MRIGCLQFAPQVGDIDNNLNRADAVLSRSDPGDLDLLVLPELAFSGYNFKSLQDISPFLEPPGSGISSLWARTSALKYDCTVIAGYPEKVDPNIKWPTGPEYYNSAIVVNEEGETIANYRKSHLYYTDETWALEGPSGFFRGKLPRLGQTAIGICMDINPYKFQTPWDKYEFANHVLDSGASLVVVSMAWITQDDPRMFSRMPQEPDMETLTYWISRLEPIIRAQLDEEIIVVFANRSGTESETTYAGTSAVVGIKSGEVLVYGILGRGDKALLVVDTETAPYARLVYRPEGSSSGTAETTESSGGRAVPGEAVQPSSGSDISSGAFPTSEEYKTEDRYNPEHQHSVHDYRPADLSIDTSYTGLRSNQKGSPNVNTPTAPSPTPLAVRPHLTIPGPPVSQEFHYDHSPASPTVFGNVEILGGDVHFYGLGPGSNVSPSYASEARYSESSVESSLRHWQPASEPTSAPVETRWTPPDYIDEYMSDLIQDGSVQENRYSLRSDVSVWNNHPGRPSNIAAVPTPPDESTIRIPDRAQSIDRQSRNETQTPYRPESPKSRNASRSRGLERSDSAAANPSDLGEICRKLEDIAFRAESVEARRRSTNGSGSTSRFFSPPSQRESRNATRSLQSTPFDCDSEADSRAASRTAITIAMDPQLFGDADSESYYPYSSRPPSSRGTGPPIVRPASLNRVQPRADVSPGPRNDRTMARSSSFYRNQIRSNTSATNNDDDRAISRGRPRAARSNSGQQRTPSHRRSNNSGSRTNQGTPAEPIDLSQFRLIEEYRSADCPVHGSRSRSRTGHGQTSGSRPGTSEQSGTPRFQQPISRVESRDRQANDSRGSRRRSRHNSNTPNGPPKASPMPKNRAATTGPQSSTSKTGGTVETVMVVNAPVTSPTREPKTPVAMVLVFDDQEGEDEGVNATLPSLRCVERGTLASTISRPRSAIW